jgi:hypothetical protein
MGRLENLRKTMRRLNGQTFVASSDEVRAGWTVGAHPCPRLLGLEEQ